MKPRCIAVLILLPLAIPALAQPTCETVPLPVNPYANLLSVWGQNADDYYVVGASDSDPYTSSEGVIYHYLQGEWTIESPATNSFHVLHDITGVDGEYYAVAPEQIWERSSAGSWREMVLAGGGNGGMYAASRSAIFVSKYQAANWYEHFFYDGTAWSLQQTPLQQSELQYNPRMLDVWGLHDSLWVAVGDDALVVVRDTTLLFGYDDAVRYEDIQADPYDNIVLYGVWGSGESDVYVVGKGRNNSVFQGIIYHYDGVGWTEVAVERPGSLFGIWGNAPNNVYVTGGAQRERQALAADLGDPSLFHFDGSNWNELTLPAGISGLYDVWGTPGGDAVIAVGANGSIVKCLSPVGFSFSTRDIGRQEDVEDLVQNLRLNNPSWMTVKAITGPGLRDSDFVGEVTIRVLQSDGVTEVEPRPDRALIYLNGSVGTNDFIVRRPGRDLVIEATAGERRGISEPFDVSVWYDFHLSPIPSSLALGEEITIEVRILSDTGVPVNRYSDTTTNGMFELYELDTNVLLRELNDNLGEFSVTSVPISMGTGAFSFTYTAPTESPDYNSVRIQVYDQYAVDDDVQTTTLEIPLTGGGGGGGPTEVTGRYGQADGGLFNDGTSNLTVGGESSNKRSDSEPVFASGVFVGPASFGGTTLNGESGDDVFVARYDAAGNHEWALEITSPGDLALTASAWDDTGSLLLAGTAVGSFSAGGQTYALPNSNPAAWVARVTPDGRVDDVAFVTSDNGWVRIEDLTSRILGYSMWSVTMLSDIRFQTGSLIPAWNPAVEAAVFVSADNQLEMASLFGSNAYYASSAMSMVWGPAGEFIAGSFDTYLEMRGATLDSHGARDTFLLLRQSSLTSGTTEWTTGFGGTGQDTPSALALDSRGVAWIAGLTDGTFDAGGTTIGSATGRSVYLLGFSATDSAPQYARTWTGSDLAVADLAASAEGGICAVGQFSNEADLAGTILTATSPGNTDGFVAHLRADGSVNWATSIGGSGDDRANSVAAVGETDCIVGGRFEGTATIAGEVYHSAGMSDAFLVRLSGPVTAVASDRIPPVPAPSKFGLYPNPASDRVVVRYGTGKPGDVRIALVDILGRRVRLIEETNVAPGEHETTVELSGLAAGIYLCRLESADGDRTLPVAVHR